MAKVGHPLAEIKKEHNVSVRMTDEEYQKLKEYSASHKMTISQVLQKAIALLYRTKR